MGGENESTVERKPNKAGRSGTQQAGKIRMHTSSGEVHFHDDEAKIKVSVPVSDFYSAMQDLKRPLRTKKKVGRECRFIDTINNTMVVIRNYVSEPSHNNDFGNISTAIDVFRLAGNDVLTALLKL